MGTLSLQCTHVCAVLQPTASLGPAPLLKLKRFEHLQGALRAMLGLVSPGEHIQPSILNTLPEGVAAGGRVAMVSGALGMRTTRTACSCLRVSCGCPWQAGGHTPAAAPMTMCVQHAAQVWRQVFISV